MKSYVAISLSDICNLNFEKLLTSLKRRRYYQHDMADIVFPDDYKLITKFSGHTQTPGSVYGCMQMMHRL
jgi:hypothetical protein